MKALVGSGDRIALFTLPFVAAGLALNLAYPFAFDVGGPSASLREALVIGVVASGVGLAAGIGLAYLLKAALEAFGLDIPATGLVVSARTVVVALGLGGVVTVASAVLPARRAARVTPVEAMRDQGSDAGQPSTRRAGMGGAVTVLGAALLAVGLLGRSSQLIFVGAGAAGVFVGLAMLGPLVARPISRALGAPLGRRGVPGQLAQQNAMRNPARTSATAAALMVGVAVVGLMNVVASSAKVSADAEISSAMKADFVISSGAVSGPAEGFSPTLEQSVAKLPQVSSATAIRTASAGITARPRTWWPPTRPRWASCSTSVSPRAGSPL